MSELRVKTMAACDPQSVLEDVFRKAITEVLGSEYADANPQIKPSQNPELGDFQSNAAMALAKKVGEKPRDLAERIAQSAAASLDEIAEPLEIAGPGFINIKLKTEAINSMVASMSDSDLGVLPDTDTHAVVIDMCSVNVAKQMHVGHLRSTIIGDALARIMERLGRTVHRQNHLGDWGLQIGMVLFQVREAGIDLDTFKIDQLEHAYRDAQIECKSDVCGMEAAQKLNAGPHRITELEEQNAGADARLTAVKQMLVKLQQGDRELVADWHKLIRVTMQAVYEIIEMLNVKLDESTERGESFYRDYLGDVITQFQEKGLAKKDAGALVVSFEDRDRPLIIQKSDGGYLYSTTDLAAIRFRVRELEADRIIYVVDARQRDHFKDVFDAVRLIGWDVAEDGAHAQLAHIPFGAVLGDDKRPLKTRSGENVTLKALLSEAIERGTKEVVSRAQDPKAPTHGLSTEEIDAIGKAVGIGAVKYADLSNDLARDYVFNFDRMIAFEGNTGPYIQYAHARICSIFSKADVDVSTINSAPILIGENVEKSLALILLRYGGIVHAVADKLEPHRMCSYLYELANAYSSFYQNCPVLKAGDDATRLSRLHLCLLVRDVIADGLDLLGIEAPKRM